jgi:hypothetical protein
MGTSPNKLYLGILTIDKKIKLKRMIKVILIDVFILFFF